MANDFVMTDANGNLKCQRKQFADFGPGKIETISIKTFTYSSASMAILQ
jgi:hypothetical protein